MQTLEEKRVFGEKSGTTRVYVAAETGLCVVTVSADQIGEFALDRRGPVADVAAAGGRLVVATEDDVLVAEDDPDADAREYAPTGHGPAVAVGLREGSPIAADADGAVSRYADGGWTRLGETGAVRAIDGPLVAAADGAYRVVGDGLEHVGLDDVRDAAGRGVPLVAAASGLYWLGNGWIDALSGAFSVVASDGHDHAHAAGDEGLFVREGDDGDYGDDEWAPTSLPVDESVADVAYGGGIVAAVTDAGTLCVNAGDGWRHQLLGLRDVSRVAVGRGED